MDSEAIFKDSSEQSSIGIDFLIRCKKMLKRLIETNLNVSYSKIDSLEQSKQAMGASIQKIAQIHLESNENNKISCDSSNSSCYRVSAMIPLIALLPIVIIQDYDNFRTSKRKIQNLRIRKKTLSDIIIKRNEITYKA